MPGPSPTCRPCFPLAFLEQAFRLAPWAACAFAALRGARGGQLAAGGLPGGLAGASATGGWHPVVQGGRAQSVEKAV
jgi:hypothetical protein